MDLEGNAWGFKNSTLSCVFALSHLPHSLLLNPFYTLSPAFCQGIAVSLPFVHAADLWACWEHTSAGPWPVTGRLMWRFLEQQVPLTRATGPHWAFAPHCLPGLFFLLGQLFFFSSLWWDWNKAWETACCYGLTAWMCCWWPASYGAPKLSPIHFLSLSFFDLPQGRNPCLITLGEKERDQWCFWHSH